MQVWVMASINDWMLTGKIEARQVVPTSMKTGPKSLTDIALTTYNLKLHLLTKWLDSKTLITSEVKDMLRLIFASHTNYRSMYLPIDGTTVNTNWSFDWSNAAQAVLTFLERTIYLHGGHEEALMKQVPWV